MSFSSWLRNLRDILTAPRGKAKQRRRTPLRGSTLRPRLEALEDRCLLSLSPVVNYSVAASPLDATFGDFNGDTHIDVATINNSQLSILHGRGDGTLGVAQTTTAGSGLSSVAAADFNGDGRLDLALSSNATRWTGTAYVTEGWVNLLLNNGNDAGGNATFLAATSFGTGTNLAPGALAVGDLNGDGKVDVAAAQTNGLNVTVLLGNGNGTLQTSQNFATGASPGSVAIGDFNKDGKLDLVTANRGSAIGTVSVLLNTGTAGNVSFEAKRDSSITGLPHSVAVGDFDADGNLDLAVTSNVSTPHTFTYYGYYGGLYTGTYYTNEGFVNVLLGTGTGMFAAPKATLVTTNELGDLTVGDLNSDGKLDVVTSDGIIRPYVDPTVLIGLGDGTFDAPYYFTADSGPNSVMVADFNRDGAPDVATANIYSSTVSVFLNDGNWAPPGAPTVSISGPSAVLEKNDGTTTVTFTVTLSAPFNQTITVDYSTTDGTALAGTDYLAKSDTLTFNPDGPLTQSIEVQVRGDRFAEADEHFLVTLSNPFNARMGTDQAAAYIMDDEPRISIGNATVVEGNTGTTEALFTVYLEQAYDQDVTLTYATAAGSAAPGSDYEHQSSGTVTIRAGDTTGTVRVLVLGDRIFEQTAYTNTYYDWYSGYYTYTYFEDNEYFSVNLGSSDIGTIVNGTGTGTIQDDDPRFSIAPAYSPAGQSLAYQVEGNSGTKVFTFAVTMAAGYDIPVTVSYNTADGTATAGSDYVAATNRTLTFNPGGPLTQYIDVVVNGDRLVESNEYFYVNLSNPTYGAVVNGQTSGTILNDEPTISIGDVYKNEGNSGTTEFMFAVYLSAAYDQDVTVNFRTVNGTATSGSDYQAKTGTLTFKAGVTVMYISILVYGDTAKEANETFSVELTGSSSNASIYDAWGLGYIYNDDTTPGRGKKK